jgi:hypothetical protein
MTLMFSAEHTQILNLQGLADLVRERQLKTYT